MSKVTCLVVDILILVLGTVIIPQLTTVRITLILTLKMGPVIQFSPPHVVLVLGYLVVAEEP